MVALAVTDEGIGIAPDELDGILQPFHGGFAAAQVWPVDRSPHRQRLWRQLQMSSASGKGTTVTVKLPAAQMPVATLTAATCEPGDEVRLQSEAASRKLIMATDTATEPATTAPARVLVVDDERSMRELLSIVLKRDGYEVLVADDGVRAIELLKKQRVDILITDIRMPQMSGVDVLREAKNIDPEIISIVMTAFASTDTAVEALRLGAADYVHKSPSAANELRLRVRKELERQAPAARERAAQARVAELAQVLEHHRPQRPDAGGVPADRDDRADRAAPC